MSVPAAPEAAAVPKASKQRLAIYYTVLAAITAAVVAVTLTAGSKKHAQPNIAGTYAVATGGSCLSKSITLMQSGQYVDLENTSAKTIAHLTFKHGRLTGTVRCAGGLGVQPVNLLARGKQLTSTSGLPVVAAFVRALPLPGTAPTPKAGAKPRTFDSTLTHFLLALVVVMVAARLVGSLMPAIGQPRVMGEVLAGIILGPTLVGRLLPGAEKDLFPSDVVPYLGVAAELGLIFYMFLVGLELDFRALRGRLSQALAVSNTSVAVPMMAGLAIAIPLYTLLAPPKRFAAFALFMGVAMSITAFPVLARIIIERRMTRRPMGVLALASAAVDDVTAWFLIALATAVATAGSGLTILRTIGETIAYAAVLFILVRPLLRRASIAYDEAGRVPATWIAAIFVAVVLGAYTTDKIGVAVIFGAFLMGIVMPRNAGFTEDITRRVEDFVVTLLLPLFFVYTGLKTNFLLLNRGSLVLITVALVAVAITCKFGGAVLAARVTRMPWRDSSVLGTLMNTRGLTELIVLNLALDSGVISPALFAAMVIMALVTTFMAGPVLRILDPHNEFGEVEEQLDRARRQSVTEAPVPIPERSILLAPQNDEALSQLLGIARLLAGSQPPREILLARLVPPPRRATVSGGLQTEFRMLSAADQQLQGVRSELLNDGIAARAVAFTSSEPGADLVRMAEREPVDLILMDGRRPLLGAGVPRGEVGVVLRDAAADVGVLVAREDQQVLTDSDSPVVIPFGGAEHDWAALELGAWIASASGARLELLGAADGGGEARDPTRLLANASLVVQQFAGIAAEPIVAERGDEGLINAAGGAGLLIIGLSERWRQEGLGRVRAEIARAAPAPILFVRRGSRPGALAPRDSMTRFNWSTTDIAAR